MMRVNSKVESFPCAAPLDKGHLFQAKYVPFKAVMEGDPWKSEESYSLDEVIYR